MKQIVWLASYPKSGNTWLRILFTYLLREAERPVDINDLAIGVASSRAFLDDWIGFDTSDLRATEIDRLRPEAYRAYARSEAGPHFLKIHDAYGHLDTGAPLIPADATRMVLYVVRSPLDVAVAYAHHNGRSIARTIYDLADERHALMNLDTGLLNQVNQHLGSWSTHVRSWTEAALPCHVVRYEDLTLAPLATLRAAVEAAGLRYPDARLQQALDHSRIEHVAAQEAAGGFIEKNQASPSPFFRKGIVGDWRTRLSERQVRRLVEDHGDVMARFGYLDARGAPVF